jgi:hypothetical protein
MSSAGYKHGDMKVGTKCYPENLKRRNQFGDQDFDMTLNKQCI